MSGTDVAGTAGPSDVAARRRSETQNIPPALHRLASRTLRIGVSFSAAILIVGIIRLWTSGTSPVTGPFRLDVGSLPSQLASGNAYAVIWLGLIVLALTPFSRVVLSVGLYLRSGDRAFTAMTLFVLAVLLASIAAGVAV